MGNNNDKLCKPPYLLFQTKAIELFKIYKIYIAIEG
jgi:hypothetical protein